jgi:hypothetical protein
MTLDLKEGRELVCAIDCSSGPRGLESGGIGWFEQKETQWLRGWKLRAQVSITRVQVEVAEGATSDRLGVRSFATLNGGFQLFVEAEAVTLLFPTPDAINWMQKAFGCSDGGDIRLSHGSFRVQALVYAKTSDLKSMLRRTGDTLEFIKTRNGQETVLSQLTNQTTQAARMAAFQAAFQAKGSLKKHEEGE